MVNLNTDCSPLITYEELSKMTKLDDTPYRQYIENIINLEDQMEKYVAEDNLDGVLFVWLNLSGNTPKEIMTAYSHGCQDPGFLEMMNELEELAITTMRRVHRKHYQVILKAVLNPTANLNARIDHPLNNLKWLGENHRVDKAEDGTQKENHQED